MSIQEDTGIVTTEPIVQINSDNNSIEESERTIYALIFDIDDTLYDEVDYCKSGFFAVAEYLEEILEDENISSENIFQYLWQEFYKGNHTRTFDAVLEMLEMDYNDEFVEELVQIYREHKPKIKLPKDTLAVLKQLKKKYTLGIVTDGFLPAQELKVQALKLKRFFTSIVYTEELGREFWKPSNAGFEKILDNLQIKAENAVYIADNEKKDFAAPNRLGFLTIQLIRDAHLHSYACDKPGYAAHHIIKQINQLPSLLDKYSLKKVY